MLSVNNCLGCEKNDKYMPNKHIQYKNVRFLKVKQRIFIHRWWQTSSQLCTYYVHFFLDIDNQHTL